MDALATQARVVAYSERYHWPNAQEGDLSDYTPAQHAADLAALIERLNLAPAVVVGQSYGGLITLTMATRYPHLVRALVIAEPPVFSWLDGTEQGREFRTWWMKEIDGPTRAEWAQSGPEAGVRTFIDGVTGIPGSYDALPAAIRERMLQNARTVHPGISSVHDTYVTRDEVRQLTVPVLLVQGEVSPAILVHIVDELQICLPQSERVVIPNASHGMWAANPDACNAALQAFLVRLAETDAGN
jgi:pimeloyl-ACP methyl ester carboxylesterase